MNPVAKTVWLIESRLNQSPTLEEAAAASGVSRTQLARLFPMVTGHSVGGYARGRRLSEAARRLAEGAPDILSVALDAGYGSHEAFTRAFRDRFGVTPEAVRERREITKLKLVEPIRMDAKPNQDIAEPRITVAEPKLIAGLAARFPCDDPSGIPPLWQKFAAHLGHIEGQVEGATFGVVLDMAENGETFQYIAGVEVTSVSGLPREFMAVRFPAQRYAVFASKGHISTIRPVIGAGVEWLHVSGMTPATLPNMLEVYPRSFDPATGYGGFEIWMPVEG